MTLLLKDALGGNCETVMLCCVSTSESSLRDTLSTLKYGHLARQINNSPVVNEVRHLNLISWSQIFKIDLFLAFLWFLFEHVFLTCFLILNNMRILSNIASSLTKVFNAMTLERPILKCCLEKWSWYSNNFSMHESPKSKIL